MPHVRPALTALAVTLFLAACQDASGPVSAVPPAPRAAAVTGDAEVIPGQYIVVLRDATADVPGKAKQLAGLHKGVLKHVYGAALKGFAVKLPDDAAVTALRADPSVAYVEQDQVMHATTEQTGATWGIDRIDQVSLPLSGTYNYVTTASDVTAYIIDTGIEFAHQELGGRATSGYDAVDGGSADDCNGHGTHVSGTVGGTRYGVAKGVKLVAVRVLDCNGNGTNSGVIAGVDWVTANHASPAVANMSLGGGASTALDDAVASSIASGVTYAIAAGNGNFLGIAQDACTTSPARVASAITVSATDNTDRKASWANYGSCVDIFAPGVDITSSYWNSSDPTGTNWYATMSGTSMATPHVTGAAALYLELDQSASPAAVASALTSNATTGKVSSAGSGSPNRLLYTGFIGGTVTPPPTPADQPPTAAIAKSCSGFSCTFTSTSTDDHGIAAQQWTLSGGSTSSPLTGTSITVSYARNSSGSVSLQVTDTAGQSASASASVSCNRKKCQ